jgi:chemotaxis protein methyltransferase CheR
MALRPENFEFIRTTLRERSAQCLEDDKGYLVETRLLTVAHRHGFASVDDLVLRLRGRRDERLLAEVIEAMTINETSFFRDGLPFEVLTHTVLPALIRKRVAARCLHIWCAACSTGQEPYSVALILRQHFPELAGWNVRLIASDLSAAVLERARRGVYSELEVSRGLMPELLRTYFHQHGHRWQVDVSLRQMVEFQRINLSGPWPPLPPLDMVLLRNVLIYFDVPTKQRILEKVRGVLRPDGYLLLGGAESTHHLNDAWSPTAGVGVSLYRPPGAPAM